MNIFLYSLKYYDIQSYRYIKRYDKKETKTMRIYSSEFDPDTVRYLATPQYNTICSNNMRILRQKIKRIRSRLDKRDMFNIAFEYSNFQLLKYLGRGNITIDDLNVIYKFRSSTLRAITYSNNLIIIKLYKDYIISNYVDTLGYELKHIYLMKLFLERKFRVDISSFCMQDNLNMLKWYIHSKHFNFDLDNYNEYECKFLSSNINKYVCDRFK